MRHLEHVGPEVDPGAQQRLLGLDLGVAGQHDPQAAHGGPQDQRGIVGVGAGVVERRRRAEDVQPDRARRRCGCRRPASARPAPAAGRPSARSVNPSRVRRAGRPARRPPCGRAPHPAAPPTWSRWKWVSRSRGMSVTPRSSRHRSIGTGSGPASISTAACGPAFSTSASPCPTSQATNAQPGGGHVETTARTGNSTIAAVTAATASSRRRPACSCQQPQRGRHEQQEHAAGRAGRPRDDRPLQAPEVVGDPGQPATRPPRQPGERLPGRECHRSDDGRAEPQHRRRPRRPVRRARSPVPRRC